MDIKKSLETALKIELATIPLYLYAMHSIRIDGTEQGRRGAFARAKIGVVVQQEMLHLALAGNVYTALDSDVHLGPKLYSGAYLAQYGHDEVLFFEIPLNLEPCNKKCVELFLKLESPYIEPVDDGEPTVEPRTSAAMALPQKPGDVIGASAKSIGEFYAKLRKDATRITQWGNKDYQFSPTEFFATSMVQVTDKESAFQAFETIIEQGEGSSANDDAHYQIFLALWNDVDWKWWPVPSSPTTELYRSSPFVYQLALAHNAAFCYLLITIQKCWDVSTPFTRQALNRNVHAIMLNISGPLGYFMAKQPFQGGTAGPPFEYYSVPGAEDLDRVDEAARALHKAIGVHLDNAIAVADTSQSEELWPLRLCVDRIAWPIAEA